MRVAPYQARATRVFSKLAGFSTLVVEGAGSCGFSVWGLDKGVVWGEHGYLIWPELLARCQRARGSRFDLTAPENFCYAAAGSLHGT